MKLLEVLENAQTIATEYRKERFSATHHSPKMDFSSCNLALQLEAEQLKSQRNRARYAEQEANDLRLAQQLEDKENEAKNFMLRQLEDDERYAQRLEKEEREILEKAAAEHAGVMWQQELAVGGSEVHEMVPTNGTAVVAEDKAEVSVDPTVEQDCTAETVPTPGIPGYEMEKPIRVHLAGTRIGVVLDKARKINGVNAKYVVIDSVVPKGPAAAAALEAGDILVSVNGIEVTSPVKAQQLIASSGEDGALLGIRSPVSTFIATLHKDKPDSTCGLELFSETRPDEPFLGKLSSSSRCVRVSKEPDEDDLESGHRQIAVGDILLAINGQRIESVKDANLKMRSALTGALRLRVQRWRSLDKMGPLQQTPRFLSTRPSSASSTRSNPVTPLAEA